MIIIILTTLPPNVKVFETMFYGDMADKSKYIRISDVAPIGFENLLRYAYTDSLNLNSVEDAMLTAYAAKKYLLPQLLRECLTYIEHNIGPSTACVVFEFAHVLNSQQLVLQAMNLIDRQTLNVINSKTFTHVQASTVEFVANRKYLTLDSEFTLFNSIINWTLTEMNRRQMDPNDWRTMRAILAEDTSILGAIRFLSMTQEEFARAVVRTSGSILAPLRSIYRSNSGQLQHSMTLEDGAGGIQNDSGADAGTGADDVNNSNNNADDGCKRLIEMVNPEDANSLLNHIEQRSVFLNLNLGDDCAKLPHSLSQQTHRRQAPPEYFTLKRFRSSSPNLVINTTTTRNIKSISSKFQCLSENVFIVGLTIPIRLDASSYANRTPKFECHLKFTTRQTSQSSIIHNNISNDSTTKQQSTQDPSSFGGGSSGIGGGGGSNAGTTLLMDTIDESLHISIARDKDCLVRLKRPILIRMGHVNELNLTFQTYALDEDIVALRTPKLRSANFSEQTDGENISWLFFKSSNIEFSELHYYY